MNRGQRFLDGNGIFRLFLLVTFLLAFLIRTMTDDEHLKADDEHLKAGDTL